ncbi:hypothetical protein MMC10_004014 [Thelotrema lepadinum]|nr:hypothetical protein [Thelotrema lepadinum]
MQLSSKTLLLLLPLLSRALAAPMLDAAEPFPVASSISVPRDADLLQNLENDTKQILNNLGGKVNAQAGNQAEIQALQDDIARLKALQAKEGPAAAAGEQKGIDSIQAVLDNIEGKANKTKRAGAGNQAEIQALEDDIARLKALQAKEGPAAAAGEQKGIDSIQAVLDRLQGKNPTPNSNIKRADNAAIAALEADIARLKALQAKEGPAAAVGEQKGIDSIQAVLDRLEGKAGADKAGAAKAGDEKVKRAGEGNEAAIAALQADIARLKALQGKEGPAAKEGIQTGIDSIEAELGRLQGQ